MSRSRPAAIGVTGSFGWVTAMNIPRNLTNATPTLGIPFWIFLGATLFGFAGAALVHLLHLRKPPQADKKRRSRKGWFHGFFWSLRPSSVCSCLAPVGLRHPDAVNFYVLVEGLPFGCLPSGSPTRWIRFRWPASLHLRSATS